MPIHDQSVIDHLYFIAMSKILFVADVHLGVGNRLNDIIWALKSVREYAKENNIEHVFILGDLFHDRVKITIDVGCAAYDFFKETKDVYGQQWSALLGNHDMYLRNSWEINSAKFLSDVITIFSDVSLVKIDERRFWLVPFIYFEDVYMKLMGEIHKQHQEGDVLLTHVGAHNATLNECFLIKHWSVVDFTNSPFDRIYAGHFHCHQQVGDNMWYVGSLIPFKFDEGVVAHGFIEFDLNTRNHKFIDIFKTSTIHNPPPDFLTITDDSLSNVELLPLANNNVRVVLGRDYSTTELNEMRDKIIARGARRVAWMKTRGEEIVLAESSESLSSSSFDSFNLLKTWVGIDKPAHVDTEFLFRLNEDIVNTGNENVAIEEDSWESV